MRPRNVFHARELHWKVLLGVEKNCISPLFGYLVLNLFGLTNYAGEIVAHKWGCSFCVQGLYRLSLTKFWTPPFGRKKSRKLTKDFGVLIWYPSFCRSGQKTNYFFKNILCFENLVRAEAESE